jgi:hypothetical protein
VAGVVGLSLLVSLVFFLRKRRIVAGQVDEPAPDYSIPGPAVPEKDNKAHYDSNSLSNLYNQSAELPAYKKAPVELSSDIAYELPTGSER